MTNGKFGSTEYGQSWAVAVTMLDGTKTIEEIIEHFQVVKRRFGVFSKGGNYQERYIRQILTNLIEGGWVEELEGKYRLTPEGKKEAEKAYKEIKISQEWVQDRLFNPISVSRVTLIVHFLLALIKVPLGIISGSIGLLNDGIDTLLDGLSSTLVYLGIKYDRERIVNIILITIMFITGIITFHQAIRRFFAPVENSIDLLTLTAVVFSGLISLILMLYQRFIGIKKNNFSLITQSVDSRNHLIVAGGVIVGMCGSYFNLGIIDTLVGLAVSFLILKGAADLIIEVIKGEEYTSKYSMFNASKRFFKKRLQNWLLRKIDSESLTRTELKEAGLKALDFRDNITLKSVGLHNYQEPGQEIEAAIDLLEEKKLIINDNQELKLSSRNKSKTQYFKSLFNPVIDFRYLLNKFIIFPACLFSFLLLYYISLTGLSYLPNTHLWQEIDYSLLSIGFPWLETLYEFTFMNLTHFIAGFALYIYAMFHLINITVVNHDALDPETRKPVELITEGYYANVRHPMYGMMVLMYTGFFFAQKSWLSLIIGLILTLILLINGWYEEKYKLIPRFGNEYKEYRQEVISRYFNRKIGVILLIYILIAAGGIIFT